MEKLPHPPAASFNFYKNPAKKESPQNKRHVKAF
jgi:hypothetical protein